MWRPTPDRQLAQASGIDRCTPAETGRLVVLGDPGSGKSTLCDWLVREFSRSEAGPSSIVSAAGCRCLLDLLGELRLGPDHRPGTTRSPSFFGGPSQPLLGGSPDKPPRRFSNAGRRSCSPTGWTRL
jgi:hypothetical protein